MFSCYPDVSLDDDIREGRRQLHDVGWLAVCLAGGQRGAGAAEGVVDAPGEVRVVDELLQQLDRLLRWVQLIPGAGDAQDVAVPLVAVEVCGGPGGEQYELML